MRKTLFAALALALLAGAGACHKKADPANPAEMKEELAGKVGWVLGRVDPTDAQRKQVDGLLDRLAPDLFALQEENTALKRRLVTVLSADTVDAAALEATRQDALALFDRYTKRMMRAGVDAIGILTPAQRKRLVGMWRRYEFGGD